MLAIWAAGGGGEAGVHAADPVCVPPLLRLFSWAARSRQLGATPQTLCSWKAAALGCMIDLITQLLLLLLPQCYQARMYAWCSGPATAACCVAQPVCGGHFVGGARMWSAACWLCKAAAYWVCWSWWLIRHDGGRELSVPWQNHAQQRISLQLKLTTSIAIACLLSILIVGCIHTRISHQLTS